MKMSLLLNAGSNKKKLRVKSMFGGNSEEKFKSINKHKKDEGYSGGISPNIGEFNKMMSKASGGFNKKKSLFKKKM